MFEPENLIVNPTSGRVHRKTCGSIRRNGKPSLALQMFTLPANMFRSICDQRDYSGERGWRGCRTCKPFPDRATKEDNRGD